MISKGKKKEIKNWQTHICSVQKETHWGMIMLETVTYYTKDSSQSLFISTTVGQKK